jgi:hypothetical protein
MFKPISFNVIRQVLAWEKIPTPLKIRMLSTFKWPDGSTSGECMLTWDGRTVTKQCDAAALYDGSAAYTDFLNALRECFCGDIKVVQAHYEVQTDRMAVELYMKVNSHEASQLQFPQEVYQ